ncbi:hypothetical protein YDYSY3_30270 [Paenibacillus chitinolyticus]|nr:hypothetical protein YDYSY3_30270 [Paenibacillus chitinolyticus]
MKSTVRTETRFFPVRGKCVFFFLDERKNVKGERDENDNDIRVAEAFRTYKSMAGGSCANGCGRSVRMFFGRGQRGRGNNAE